MALVSTEIPAGGGARVGGDEGRSEEEGTDVGAASQRDDGGGHARYHTSAFELRLKHLGGVIKRIATAWWRLLIPTHSKSWVCVASRGGGEEAGRSDQRVSGSSTSVMTEKENHPEYRNIGLVLISCRRSRVTLLNRPLSGPRVDTGERGTA